MTEYTVRAAAIKLGCKKSALNKRIERGQVKTRVVDGWMHMIPESEVIRLQGQPK